MNVQEVVDTLKESGNFTSVYAGNDPTHVVATPDTSSGGWVYDIATFRELAEAGWIVLDVSEHNRLMFGRLK